MKTVRTKVIVPILQVVCMEYESGRELDALGGEDRRYGRSCAALITRVIVMIRGYAPKWP